MHRGTYYSTVEYGTAMRSADTDQATEQVHLELLRSSPPGRRLAMALSLSATVVGLSRRGLARANPNSGPEELDILFVQRCYGGELANEVRSLFLRRVT